MTSLLELDNLTHYYGDLCALRDVSLEMGPGAIGLVGQNGAGKSTLMQILLGLIRPTEGSARVMGHDLKTSGVQLRGRVGFMPERDSIVPGLNGIEYVALAGELCGMPSRQAKRRAHETLSYLGMEDARYRRLEQYSVGMTQRLKLAATLVHDPDLLLLDEPTAGLDPEGRAAMLALLRALGARPGKSLVLSSHLLGDIERVCNSAIILNQGQVIGVGTLESLRANQQRCFQLRWEATGESGEADDSSVRFVAAMRARGLEVDADIENGKAKVLAADDWNSRNFFADATASGVLLTGLEPEEEDLEAVYRRVIQAAKSN